MNLFLFEPAIPKYMPKNLFFKYVFCCYGPCVITLSPRCLLWSYKRIGKTYSRQVELQYCLMLYLMLSIFLPSVLLCNNAPPLCYVYINVSKANSLLSSNWNSISRSDFSTVWTRHRLCYTEPNQTNKKEHIPFCNKVSTSLLIWRRVTPFLWNDGAAPLDSPS
jgi:hypothetical protein